MSPIGSAKSPPARTSRTLFSEASLSGNFVLPHRFGGRIMRERATSIRLIGGLIMADRISRGEIISLLAGIPAAVAVTTSVASAADDSGGTKAQYKYQAKPGPKGQVDRKSV